MVSNSILITQATPYLQELLNSSQKYKFPDSLINLISRTKDLYSENVANGLLSSPEQWWFILHSIRNLSLMHKDKLNCLEIGSFSGCASLMIAREPSVNTITLVDIDSKAIALAEQAFIEENIHNKFKYYIAPGKHAMDKLINEKSKFHFIFIDADKQKYDMYYEKGLELLCDNGLMIIDNVLWRGQVWDESFQDETTRKMRAFNQMVINDKRIDAMLLPIGDGMYSIVKHPI